MTFAFLAHWQISIFWLFVHQNAFLFLTAFILIKCVKKKTNTITKSIDPPPATCVGPVVQSTKSLSKSPPSSGSLQKGKHRVDEKKKNEKHSKDFSRETDDKPKMLKDGGGTDRKTGKAEKPRDKRNKKNKNKKEMNEDEVNKQQNESKEEADCLKSKEDTETKDNATQDAEKWRRIKYEGTIRIELADDNNTKSQTIEQTVFFDDIKEKLPRATVGEGRKSKESIKKLPGRIKSTSKKRKDTITATDEDLREAKSNSKTIDRKRGKSLEGIEDLKMTMEEMGTQTTHSKEGVQ